ncbi:hypothetical protein Acr_20g0004040 [Actinidia rufa]|uniref:SAWADEE domain-containing protein n=1 Tax=Actinidia rufa TaxID=165716 RepID=A0A7J0GCQ2_9ERIC|nr:hypothetical protein Acr_20g0004040 [Actinidia rufa]
MLGKPAVKWNEVQSWWFQERHQSHPLKDADLPNTLKDSLVVPEAIPLNKTHESPLASKGEKVPDLSELEFEARSSTDGAWYDVDSFLNHRFLSSGEAERRDQARHYDAHVVEIQRRMHDIRGCRCLVLGKSTFEKIMSPANGLDLSSVQPGIFAVFVRRLSKYEAGTIWLLKIK